MNLFELVMATVICSLVAFVVYSFPVVGQVLIIALLALLWLSCAHQTVRSVRRRLACRS